MKDIRGIEIKIGDRVRILCPCCKKDTFKGAPTQGIVAMIEGRLVLHVGTQEINDRQINDHFVPLPVIGMANGERTEFPLEVIVGLA